MRAIDADELIVMEYGGIKFVPKEFIDDAPTIEVQQWIPVTERLPEYGQKCLVAFKLTSHNDWSIQVSYCYVHKEGFWSDCGRDYKAMAWMPLPEPPEKGE